MSSVSANHGEKISSHCCLAPRVQYRQGRQHLFLNCSTVAILHCGLNPRHFRSLSYKLSGHKPLNMNFDCNSLDSLICQTPVSRFQMLQMMMSHSGVGQLVFQFNEHPKKLQANLICKKDIQVIVIGLTPLHFRPCPPPL